MPSHPVGRPTTDLGTLRSLRSICDAEGFFSVVAFDHPAAFVLPAEEVGDETSRFAEAVRTKVSFAQALATRASAVLVDPEMGLPAIVATGALPGQTGLIVNIETESYQLEPDARALTQVRPGWSAAQIRAVGGDGLKLLWRYRHDVPEASAGRALVEDLREQCAAVSLPFIVEPIWVALPGEDLTDPAVRALRARAVVDYAHLAAELGADLVKTEFPGWVDTAAERADGASACAELDAGLAVPWLLLSAGVTFEQFLVQTEIAARAGSSGFIAGRAVWDVAVSADLETRTQGLAVAGRRLDQLREVVRSLGRPWQSSCTVEESLERYPQHWYLQRDEHARAASDR